MCIRVMMTIATMHQQHSTEKKRAQGCNGCQLAQKLMLILYSTFIENEISAHTIVHFFCSPLGPLRRRGCSFFWPNNFVVTLTLLAIVSWKCLVFVFSVANAVVVVKSRLTTMQTCRLYELSWNCFFSFSFRSDSNDNSV